MIDVIHIDTEKRREVRESTLLSRDSNPSGFRTQKAVLHNIFLFLESFFSSGINADSYLLGSTNQRFYWLSVYNLVFNINLLQTASETQTICWMPFYNIGEVMIYKITLVHNLI